MSETSPKTQSKVLAILSSLDHASLANGTNRRNNSRLPIRHELQIRLLKVPGTATFTIHTRNLSTGGLGFLSRRPFEVGERFVLPVKMPGTPSKVVLCRVTFSRYVSAGLYAVGSEFEQSLPDPTEKMDVPGEWTVLALMKQTSST